jgi:hypothetical protein
MKQKVSSKLAGIKFSFKIIFLDINGTKTSKTLSLSCELTRTHSLEGVCPEQNVVY